MWRNTIRIGTETIHSIQLTEIMIQRRARWAAATAVRLIVCVYVRVWSNTFEKYCTFFCILLHLCSQNSMRTHRHTHTNIHFTSAKSLRMTEMDRRHTDRPTDRRRHREKFNCAKIVRTYTKQQKKTEVNSELRNKSRRVKCKWVEERSASWVKNWKKKKKKRTAEKTRIRNSEILVWNQQKNWTNKKRQAAVTAAPRGSSSRSK